MAYEQFTKKNTFKPKYDFPVVTINKAGILSVNGACLEKFFSDNRHVNIFVDKRAKKIGLKKTSGPTRESYEIKEKKGYRGGMICVRSILKHMNIKFDRTMDFETTWNDGEELVEINLGKEIVPGHKQKKVIEGFVA